MRKQLELACSPYRQLSVRCQPSLDYPASPLSVELTSSVFPEELLAKLRAGISKTAAEKGAQDQLVAAMESAVNVVRSNLLLSVFTELNQIKELLHDTDELKTYPSKGLVRVRITAGKYHLTVDGRVPPDYPATAADVSIASSNFPNYLLDLFRSQVASVRSRLVNGFTLEKILAREARREHVMAEKQIQGNTVSDLHDLKKDLTFLKRLGDLQKESHEKEMRKQKRRIVKAESANEKERQAQEEAEIHELVYGEKKEVVRTLFPLVALLVQELGHRMPIERCIVSNLAVLPENPEEMSPELFERLFCGCWYQQAALIEYLSSPPFNDKRCARCRAEIQHSKYNAGFIRDMEQKYILRKRKEQELADVADFLGF